MWIALLHWLNFGHRLEIFVGGGLLSKSGHFFIILLLHFACVGLVAGDWGHLDGLGVFEFGSDLNDWVFGSDESINIADIKVE